MTRLAFSFLLIVTYLSIVVATSRHESLVLPDSRLPLPILNVEVSVVGFFVFAPLIVLIVHVYLLLERLRLTLRLCLVFPRRSGDVDDPRLPFLPAFLSLGLAARPLPIALQVLLSLAFVLLAILPLGALLAVQWAYRPAHDAWLTGLHQLCILVDVIGLWYLVVATYQARCGKGWKPGLRRRVGLLSLVTVPCLMLSLWPLSLPHGTKEPYGLNHHLDLQRWQPPPAASQRGRLRFGLDDLRFANLAEAQLRGADLRELDLRRANLAGTDLRQADLRRARLQGADLSGADLRGADLGGAELQNARLTDSSLEGASLIGARLQGVSAQGASFFAADLSYSRLTAADLRKADLRLARLTDAWLRLLFDSRRQTPLVTHVSSGTYSESKNR